MCRHLAHLGPPAPLAALVSVPDHGLLRQAHAPRDMRGGGTINADGFGVGWYPTPGAAALRYRSVAPIWSDTTFAGLAAATTAVGVLGAVRSATTGMPVIETAAAPFTDGRWLFSLNGRVSGWPGSVAPLAATLPVTDLLTLDAPTDSALLWAVLRRRLAGLPGDGVVGGERVDGDRRRPVTEDTAPDPGAVLADLVVEVAAVAPASRLNLLLTDGATVWATTWGHALSVRTGGAQGTEGTDGADSTDGAAVTVASEPLDDDPGWAAVPDRHLLVARPGSCTWCPLADPPGVA